MDMKGDLAIMSHVGHLRTTLEFVTNVKRQNSFKRNVTFRKLLQMSQCCPICDIFCEDHGL